MDSATQNSMEVYMGFYERNVREICRILEGTLNSDAVDGLTFRMKSLRHLLGRYDSRNMTSPGEKYSCLVEVESLLSGIYYHQQSASYHYNIQGAFLLRIHVTLIGTLHGI